MASASDIAVAEAHRRLMEAISMQHTNGVCIGKGSGASGEAQCLHHIDGPYQCKIAWAIHLADHEDPVAAGSLYLHGDDGVGHKFSHPQFKLGSKLVSGAPCRLHVAG